MLKDFINERKPPPLQWFKPMRIGKLSPLIFNFGYALDS